MKKTLLFLVFLALSFGLKAQCPPEVDNFTFTDCYGVEYNLFELLDNGQYVLMEFRPVVGGNVSQLHSVYHQYGCNGRDIFFLEVLPQANDSVAQDWINSTIFEIPVITTDGEGGQFYSQYQDCIDASWSKLLLIHPDHAIHSEPIMEYYDLSLIFWNLGVYTADCNFGICSAPGDLTVENIDSDSVQLQLSWSGVEDALYYHLYSVHKYFSDFLKNAYDTVCQVNYSPVIGACYSVVSHCEDGSECASDTVCVTPQAIDFHATDCHGNDIHLFDILDRGQYVLIDYFWYTCSSCRDIMPNMLETYYRYGCNYEDIYYLEVDQIDGNAMCLQWCEEFGVEYPTISKEGGGVEISELYKLSNAPHCFLIAPDHTIVWDSNSPYPFEYVFSFFDLQSVIDAYEAIGIEVHQCYADLDEKNGLNVGLFPNPADGFVSFSVEGSNVVRIYNAFGQFMDSFVIENQQVRIKTSNYPEGLYFVQVDGQGFGKFVVRH